MTPRTALHVALSATKQAAAHLTDTLAAIGERIPPVAQLTVSAFGVTVTVNPKPEPPRPCATCGRP
jgi:hypothetical protein